MSTATLEFPGLDAYAQRIFEIPYAELTPNLQAHVRRMVAQSAAEEMLEAANCASNLLYLLSDEVAKLGFKASKVGEKLNAAIAKAEGRE